MRQTAWISIDVLQAIADDAKRWFPSETGGILLGYWARSREVVITSCTTAGPLARHTAMLYVPDSGYDEKMIATLYEQSGRLHTYLGDWHTHPRHSAYMSNKDLRTLQQIALEPAARTKVPVMLIAGGGPTDWRPRLWCCRCILGRRMLVPMIIRSYGSA